MGTGCNQIKYKKNGNYFNCKTFCYIWQNNRRQAAMEKN